MVGKLATTSGIVLAGGQSRRMGRDKALLELDGRSLLTRTAEVMARVAGEVLVVGRDSLPPDVALARAIPDVRPGLGPIGGLLTGLDRIESERCLVVGVDMPFLDPHLLGFLIESASGAAATVPLVEGRAQPLHAVYSRSILPVIQAQIGAGDYSMRSLLANLDVCWIGEAVLRVHDPHLRSFLNVNDAEEWLRIREANMQATEIEESGG